MSEPLTIETLNKRARAPRRSSALEIEEQERADNAHALMLQQQQQFEDEPEETETDRVADLLSSVTNDNSAQVKVYRACTTGMEYCATYTPAQFEAKDLDLIRESFGPGEYHIHLRGRLPSGRSGLLRKTMVRIAESSAPSAPVAASGGANGELGAILTAVLEGQQQTQALIAQIANNRTDPMADMKNTLALMVTMREAFGMNANQPQQKSSIGELADAMREMKALSGEFNGEKSDDGIGSLVELAKPIMSMVGDSMKNRQQIPVIQVPPARAALPRPQQHPSQSPTQQPTTAAPAETDDDMSLVLKAQLFYIETQAKLGTNTDGTINAESVEKTAHYLADKMPEEMLDIMETPTWFEFLTHEKAAPSLAPYKVWVTAVRDRVIEILYAPEPDLADPVDPTS